jgi:hypothetical protein
MAHSAFFSPLIKAGLVIQPDGGYALPNVSAFKDEVGRSGADVLASLCTHLDALLGDPAFLRGFLQPCHITGPHTPFLRESLCRLLLNTPPVQPMVAKVLLQNLPDYEVSDPSLATRIIHQFRWLDFIASPTEFLDTLLEVLGVLQEDLRRELLSLLPGVAGHGQQPRVVAAILTLAREDSNLLIPCLDALGSLDLDPAMLKETLDLVLSKLHAIKADGLPVTIRFLLQVADADTAVRIITDLRNTLPLTQPRDTREKGRANAAAQTSALILDALRSGLRFRKDLVAIVVRELGDPSPCRPTDLLLALLIHSLGPPAAARVEGLLQTKVATGLLPFDLARQTLAAHAAALTPHFGSLQAIAGACLRAPGRPSVGAFGQQLLVALFDLFPSPFHRHEVLGAVLSLVGPGSLDEVTVGLDLLLALIERHFDLMQSLASILTGLLDDMIHMPLPHIRKVYTTFAALTFAQPALGPNAPASQGLRDELHMMVTKQLSHPDPWYKVLGYVGLSAILAAADRDLPHIFRGSTLGAVATPSPASSQEHTIAPPVEAQLTSMLDHAFRTADHAGPALPHLFDELTRAVEAGPLARPSRRASRSGWRRSSKATSLLIPPTPAISRRTKAGRSSPSRRSAPSPSTSGSSPTPSPPAARPSSPSSG